MSVSGYLIGSQAANQAPLPPRAELAWWYQFYFATERGRAGYDKYRREFARLIWRTASPKWDFDDATFNRTAASFDNPDHVSIVIHNYRWRISLADGEARYNGLEHQLADSPVITVPTITLEGDANGAPHPDPGTYAAKFTGPAIFSASLLAAAREVRASRTWTGLAGSGRMALIDHRDAAPPARSLRRSAG